jgi:hypothetical protein
VIFRRLILLPDADELPISFDVRIWAPKDLWSAACFLPERTQFDQRKDCSPGAEGMFVFAGTTQFLIAYLNGHKVSD